MSMKKVISDESIKEAVKTFFATETFGYEAYTAVFSVILRDEPVTEDVFHTLDQNNSGYLEKDDVRLTMKAFKPNIRELSDKEVMDIITGVDKGGDSKISLENFKAMMVNPM